jgi:ParB-like chromosome segregation protein Spo0J
LAIRERKLAELTASPHNPRVHSPRQIQQIARSITTFGFNSPVLVDRHGRIIAGHGRVEAARTLGMTHVPTIQLDHLSAAESKAFVVADNRLAELASWDQELLGVNFAELLAEELTFDISVIGFEIPEIDDIVLGVSALDQGRQ